MNDDLDETMHYVDVLLSVLLPEAEIEHLNTWANERKFVLECDSSQKEYEIEYHIPWDSLVEAAKVVSDFINVVKIDSGQIVTLA